MHSAGERPLGESSSWYCHTVRILTHAYALVICLEEEEGGERLHMGAADLHIAKLRSLERLDSASEPFVWAEIAESGTNMRAIRREKQEFVAPTNLADIGTSPIESA